MWVRAAVAISWRRPATPSPFQIFLSIGHQLFSSTHPLRTRGTKIFENYQLKPFRLGTTKCKAVQRSGLPHSMSCHDKASAGKNSISHLSNLLSGHMVASFGH